MAADDRGRRRLLKRRASKNESPTGFRAWVLTGNNFELKGAKSWSGQVTVRSQAGHGQVRFITRPKPRTMRATRRMLLPPK